MCVVVMRFDGIGSPLNVALLPLPHQLLHHTQVILLGDSAVGKSKLVERFLMNEYNPRQVHAREQLSYR